MILGAAGGATTGVTVGSSSVGESLSDRSVTSLLLGSFPVTTAWFVTNPFATSALVITCVAVKVVLSPAPAAKSIGTPETVALSSVMITPVRSTLPVLFTSKL